MSIRRTEVALVDDRLQQEYDSKLAESLQQMRNENDELIRRNREEVEAAYETKVRRRYNTMFVLRSVLLTILYSNNHLTQVIGKINIFAHHPLLFPNISVIFYYILTFTVFFWDRTDV
jgi:hypothetical protein